MGSGPSSAMLRIAMPDANESPLDRPRHLKERLEAEATGIPFCTGSTMIASNAS